MADIDFYRHEKTGGIYTVACHATYEKTGERVVVYQNVQTDEIWVRPYEEFYDGRFKKL